MQASALLVFPAAKPYLPAAQSMHFDAPVETPVYVPAGQGEQAVISGVEPYLPAAQSMHFVAPVATPVYVPAEQVEGQPSARLVTPSVSP